MPAIPYVPLFVCVYASNMLKSPGCFHLVSFVIVHFGNYSLFSTAAEYFFVWLGLRLFLQFPLWASTVLFICCYYNKDSRNNLSTGVRLLASFSLETLFSLAWHDTVLSFLFWDVFGCTFLSSLPSLLSPPCPIDCPLPLECQRYLRLAPRSSLLSALPSRYACSFEGFKTIYMVCHWKEWNDATYSSMNGPRECHTEWSKTEKEKYHMTSLICGI